MIKDTFGPWTVVPFSKTIHNIENSKRCIATVTVSDWDDSRGNSSLIAAAPELFEACVAALKLLRACAFTENQITLTQVRRAIEKAEGGNK